jgi:hypothetical protein
MLSINIFVLKFIIEHGDEGTCIYSQCERGHGIFWVFCHSRSATIMFIMVHTPSDDPYIMAVRKMIVLMNIHYLAIAT